MKKVLVKILGGGRSVIILVAGLALGYLLFGGAARVDRGGAAPADAEAPRAETWTCSMHAQVQKREPGQCPLCGMDLVPVDAGSEGDGLRQLVVGPAQRALMRVRTVPVERRFVEAETAMVGKIAYDETRIATITAWVPGRIDRLYVDYTGLTVREGDHMVDLYSPELYTAQEELLQALRAVEGEREGEPGTLRATARATVDASRERLRLWGLSEEQVLEIETRGSASERVTIQAPTSGLVIDKDAQRGMYVQTGTRIFTIADLGTVWVLLDAYESDMSWLRYGQRVTFETEALPGRSFAGTVSFIDPVLDPSTRTFKVRVVADNAEGLLKPDMFVRARAHARIAGQGLVMDASLAGKWVSPMHPEVVKDEPGDCDVCGMDLVPAETLGWVSESDLDLEPPTVIPVTAALRTGTRAVVYVELPDTEEPTYEGREVVLGPRAGDHYIVRHGLEEGELVVVEGNFKIDSALQIRASPSMMSPDGGRTDGDHSHDHGAEPSAPDGGAPEPGEGASEAGRLRLQAVERAYAAVERAALEGDLARSQRAFAELGVRVEETEAQHFSGEGLASWREVSMRLANDAFEGRESKTPEETARVLESLRSNVELMRRLLGSTPEEAPTRALASPPEFRNGLEVTWQAYLRLHGALASDDDAAALSEVGAMHDTLERIDGTALDEEARAHWDPVRAHLHEALERMSSAADLDARRVDFEPLSEALGEALRVFGAVDGPAHVVHCPMAFDGRGASWLQADEEVLNPYFGAEMLRCGSVVDSLAPATAPSPEGGDDE